MDAVSVHRFFSAAKGNSTLQSNFKRIIAKGFVEVNFLLIVGYFTFRDWSGKV